MHTSTDFSHCFGVRIAKHAMRLHIPALSEKAGLSREEYEKANEWWFKERNESQMVKHKRIYALT